MGVGVGGGVRVLVLRSVQATLSALLLLLPLHLHLSRSCVVTSSRARVLMAVAVWLLSLLLLLLLLLCAGPLPLLLETLCISTGLCTLLLMPPARCLDWPGPFKYTCQVHFHRTSALPCVVIVSLRCECLTCGVFVLFIAVVTADTVCQHPSGGALCLCA